LWNLRFRFNLSDTQDSCSRKRTQEKNIARRPQRDGHGGCLILGVLCLFGGQAREPPIAISAASRQQNKALFNSSVHTVTSGRAFLLLGEHWGKGRGQISIGAAKRRSINSHRKERFGALDKIARARVAVAGSHRRRVLRSQLSKRFEVPHLPAPAA
jgi:hypothetical protein